MIEPKTLEDIQVVDGVATLVGAQLVEDIKLVRQYAEDNNIEKYVAIKVEADGSFKRFALNGDTPILIADDDFGVNQKSVVPVVEPAQEQIEVKAEVLVVKTKRVKMWKCWRANPQSKLNLLMIKTLQSL